MRNRKSDFTTNYYSTRI